MSDVYDQVEVMFQAIEQHLKIIRLCIKDMSIRIEYIEKRIRENKR